MSAGAPSGPAVPTGNTYDKYGTHNPVERRLVSGFMEALGRALPPAAGRVLEVGAGEGHVTRLVSERYPDARVTALDLPDPELAGSWQGGPFQAVFGDITRLPFPDRSFDLVLAIEVLEHVDDPAAALAEVARVATGPVVLSVPREPVWRVANMARGKYLRDLGNTPGHVQHWSKRGFATLVGTRLDVRSVSSPFPWTVVQASVR